MIKFNQTLLFLLLAAGFSSCSPKEHADDTFIAITSGVPWFDNNGNEVSAHGANIIFDEGRYYLFGERKSDTSNAFTGFNCYSSLDLVNWEFENVVLPTQESGKLGPSRVGERVKVMKCPETGEYMMYMHVDSLDYRDQYVGYASCDKINGNYTFHGPLLFNGSPIKKWDMGVFQDSDGSGYLVTHSGNLFKLSDNYKSVDEQLVKDMTPQCESPAIFKKDGVYFWLGSGLTSWERNDNYYFTATSLRGPWERRGLFAPEGSLTWNSQTSFVLSIAGSEDTTFMFMGDRWAFPRQQSAATYVWQPLHVSDGSIFLPEYIQSWRVNTETGSWEAAGPVGQNIANTDTISISYTGDWIHSSVKDSLSFSQSDEKGASFSLEFTGTRIGMHGVALPNGGYASVLIQNSEGDIFASSTIDLYCKYQETSLKFLSPALPFDTYTLTVSALGDHGFWSDKRKSRYGSTGNFISLDKLVIIE